MSKVFIVFWIRSEQLSMLMGMSTLSLSELLGLTVYDCSGSTVGRVREAALVPQEDRNRVSALIVKTSIGNRILPCGSISVINGSVRASTLAGGLAYFDRNRRPVFPGPRPARPAGD